jgi:Tfp pilus assembly protein PilO
MIWREKRVVLIVVGALLVSNVFFFFTYRVRYSERIDATHTRFDEATRQLDEARAARQASQGQLAAHKKLVQTINEVNDSWWSTPEKRLTKVIVEVRTLGEKAGLAPQSISFSKRVSSEKLGTTEMEISFNVQGTYAQVRQLVNLIEQSDQFLVIDSIGINSADGSNLTLNLKLRTLFKGEPAKASKTGATS